MKKHVITAIAFATVLSAQSQEVISSSGDSYSNGTGSIDFTLGEAVIQTGSDGTNDLTQGFHQTKWQFLSVTEHDVEFEASAYPNPSTDVLTLETSQFDDVSFTIFDNQGRIIREERLSTSRTAIDVSNLAPGIYSLSLRNSEKRLQTIQLLITK